MVGQKKRYTVQAGIRLKELIHNLTLDGLAMKNLGSITEQSIAGAISTGTHRTGEKRKKQIFKIVLVWCGQSRRKCLISRDRSTLVV
jgi:FAD binding domain